MKKNAVVIIIVAIILILIGVAVYLFVKGSKKGKNLDKDGKIIDPTKDKDGKPIDTTPKLDTTPTPTPTPTPPPTYTTPTTLLPCTKDAFPMGMKAKNQCVQRLQQKLKLDDDGKFGKNTNTAVVGLGFVVPLTEADYDKIIAGLPPTDAAPASNTTPAGIQIDVAYKMLIRQIGTGAATKRYYNPNYVRVRYDASWTRAELSFFFYDDYQTSTTTTGRTSGETKPMSLPAETTLIIKNGPKVVAYGVWGDTGKNFRIYDIVTKGGKLVAGKGYKDFVEGNIWENIKAFESAIQ
jgi:hypothetical protein